MKTDLREVYLAPNRASAEVAIDGEWHDVPNFALVDPKTNKLGYAVVWLQPWTFNIRCFLPGAGAEDKAARQCPRRRDHLGRPDRQAPPLSARCPHCEIMAAVVDTFRI